MLTISTHERGDRLFPGTGFVEEIGEGAGVGFSVNLPLEAYTDDAVYLEAFEAVVPPLLRALPARRGGRPARHRRAPDRPADAPGARRAGLRRGVRRIVALAPRLVALGGGGYDLANVARAWTAAWAVMNGVDLPDRCAAFRPSLRHCSKTAPYLGCRRTACGIGRECRRPSDRRAVRTGRGSSPIFIVRQVANPLRRLVFPLLGCAPPARDAPAPCVSVIGAMAGVRPDGGPVRGVLITLEGVEGSGKTTQMARLGDGWSARLPGGADGRAGWHRAGAGHPWSVRGRRVRPPLGEVFLFLAARQQHVRQADPAWLAQGRVVLCDRYTDATVAYQGYGRGVDLDLSRRPERSATGGILPDLTLVFDLDGRGPAGCARLGARPAITSSARPSRFTGGSGGAIGRSSAPSPSACA